MFWITLWLVLMAAWLYLMGWLPWKSAREQARLKVPAVVQQATAAERTEVATLGRTPATATAH